MKGKVKIIINGQIDESWKEWFKGMQVSKKDSYTILSGEINDEAHMHGILNRIRDFNLKLISVNQLNNNE